MFPAPGARPVADYPEGISDEMQKCVGRSWDIVKKCIVTHTMEEYLDTDVHLRKSAFFMGEGGSGKTTLMHQLGRRFGIMYDKEIYIYTKVLDPLGILSKSGVLVNIAALAVADFDPVSQNGIPLSAEGLKSLLDCEEGGGFACRHYQAILAAEIPRMFAVNADEGSNWFDAKGFLPLGALSRGDTKELAEANADFQAMARRTIIFPCPSVILLEAGKQKLAKRTTEKAQTGLDRLKAFMKENKPTEGVAPVAPAGSALM